MRVTVPSLQQIVRDGGRIAMLTCYDASFARVLDAGGVDTLLVGDSLGMVIQGADSTLAVTLEQTAYHTRCVAHGASRAMVIADMPFATYQEGREQAFRNAAALMAAGAQMVKLEGGAWIAPTIAFLVERGIPVCAHIGLTPQSVHTIGGYRVQGKTEADAQRLLEDARAVSSAGASLLVLELMPAVVAQRITDTISAPTIGIGAGPHCGGQVLVLYDMLGIYGSNYGGRTPRFVRNFMTGHDSVEAAVRAYVEAVKQGSFPAPEHCF
jgi:3-methyl-2-oxobutanoate hydroxymethyltransferase